LKEETPLAVGENTGTWGGIQSGMYQDLVVGVEGQEGAGLRVCGDEKVGVKEKRLWRWSERLIASL
jgi:hypothetical protein